MSDRATTEPQVRTWADLVDQLTAGTVVPPSVVLGLMSIESGGDPAAVSAMNIYHGEYLGRAHGLMQVLPVHFGITVDPNTGEVSEAQRAYMCNPRMNLQAAIGLLASTYQALQRWDYVAASYFGAFNWTTRAITGATDATGTSGNTYVDLFLACRQWYLDVDASVATGRDAQPATGGGSAMVDKPNIVWVGCHPNGYNTGRGNILQEAIVIHTTAGGTSVKALDNWFNDENAGVSAHFGVGPNGEIHQYVRLSDTAFAHGIVNWPNKTKLVNDNAGINPNLWAIGIEHLDGGVPGTVTDAQLDASQRLAAWLFAVVILPNANRTGAVVDRDHILGHYQIGSHLDCPSWSEDRFADYIAKVQKLLA